MGNAHTLIYFFIKGGLYIQIKVNAKCKEYKKANCATQKCICDKLMQLVSKIESCGLSDINSIFNNDSIIYDRISDEFFIYKTHLRDNQQIRIVYAFDGTTIYLIDYVNKKSNNKEYLSDMSKKFKEAHLDDITFTEVYFP